MNDKHNVLPLALVGTGVVIFSIGDVIFKILTSLGIFWWDFLVFGVPFEVLVILLITVISNNFDKQKCYNELMPRRLFFPILRGFLGIIAIAAIFMSFKNLPLSLTTMLIQTAPIWMLIIAFFSYQEKPNIITLISVLLGMIGIILIVNPSYEGINKFLIFPIIVAIVNALMNYIITKRSDDAKPLSYALILFIVNGFIGLIIWAYFGMKVPSIYQISLIALCGILGSVAFIFVTYGYSMAKGHFARTGVMGYIQLPSSIILGILIFNESPTPFAYFGSCLIVLAGIMVINNGKLK